MFTGAWQTYLRHRYCNLHSGNFYMNFLLCCHSYGRIVHWWTIHCTLNNGLPYHVCCVRPVWLARYKVGQVSFIHLCISIILLHHTVCSLLRVLPYSFNQVKVILAINHHQITKKGNRGNSHYRIVSRISLYSIHLCLRSKKRLCNYPLELNLSATATSNDAALSGSCCRCISNIVYYLMFPRDRLIWPAGTNMRTKNGYVWLFNL